MKQTIEPVTVRRAAFAFCRWTMALLVWAAWYFNAPTILLLSFCIFAASAVLKVNRAPLVMLYTAGVERFLPSSEVMLDARGMRFAHMLAAGIAGLCLLVLYLGNPAIGWNIVFVFALLKTVSATGFCPATRLYTCMTGGNCCAFLKKRA